MKKWQLILLTVTGLFLALSFTKKGQRFFMSLAREIISRWEGLRLEAYPDIVGKWTIGYGHLIKPGEQYYPYGHIKNITVKEAEALLELDLQISKECVETLVQVPVSENQKAALISFTFNVGCENLRNSNMLKMINQQRYADAAEQFDKWIYARGKDNLMIKVAGLANRRAAEKETFLT